MMASKMTWKILLQHLCLFQLDHSKKTGLHVWRSVRCITSPFTLIPKDVSLKPKSELEHFLIAKSSGIADAPIGSCLLGQFEIWSNTKYHTKNFIMWLLFSKFNEFIDSRIKFHPIWNGECKFFFQKKLANLLFGKINSNMFSYFVLH